MLLSKLQHDGFRDIYKHESNMQDQTYYENDYNSDKKNRKNNSRTNSGHGAEQQCSKFSTSKQQSLK